MLRKLSLLALCFSSSSVFAINFISNAGFESGDLTGWTTNQPSSLPAIVESTVVHSGKFAALMTQDFYIDQQFAPVLNSSIQNVSYWIKQDQFQPNPTFFTANILYYSDGTNTYIVHRPANDGNWFNMDLTQFLAAGKSLVGVRVYGATTLGGNSPKTYFDDFNVGSPVPVPEPVTLLTLGVGLLGIAKRRAECKG